MDRLILKKLKRKLVIWNTEVKKLPGVQYKNIWKL